MKKLKVWSGYTHKPYPEALGERSLTLLIAAYTKKQACEISGLSYTHINNYFSETGNKFQLSVATEVGVWVLPAFENRVIKRLV